MLGIFVAAMEEKDMKVGMDSPHLTPQSPDYPDIDRRFNISSHEL